MYTKKAADNMFDISLNRNLRNRKYFLAEKIAYEFDKQFTGLICLKKLIFDRKADWARMQLIKYLRITA